jgi:hypothetical protein
VKLTTHLHLVPGLRMYGATPHFRNTSSWRDAQLSLPMATKFCSTVLSSFLSPFFVACSCVISRVVRKKTWNFGVCRYMLRNGEVERCCISDPWICPRG